MSIAREATSALPQSAVKVAARAQPLIAPRFLQGELIASGGTALVYRGYDRRTGACVAIKRLKPWLLSEQPELARRLSREACILRRVAHPNIVRLVATLREESPGIVLELVPGGSLRQRLSAEGRLPLRQALEITLELADALARAHHQGVIHRDVKPDNVLLAEDGTPRLTDFGLGRFMDQRTVLSQGIVGTLAYLSPEALWGRPLDARADLWALGALLFEMISGRRAFEGDVPGAVMAAILNQPAPDLARSCPGTPRPIAELVQRLLDKDRSRRPRSARHLAAELDALTRHRGMWRVLGRAPRGGQDATWHGE